MDETTDPYAVLGFAKHADVTLDEVKKRFKALAIVYHPDKGGTKSMFDLLTESYKKVAHHIRGRTDNRMFYDLKRDSRQGARNAVAPREADGSFIDRFNNEFEAQKQTKGDHDAFQQGYGYMMDASTKTRGDLNIAKNRKLRPSNFNKVFEESAPPPPKALVKWRVPMALPSGNGYTELGVTKVKDFSGGEASNLRYTDYKIAHETSRLVDPRMFRSRKTYNTVEEFERDRGGDAPVMDDESQQEYEGYMRKEKKREVRRRAALVEQDQMAEDHYNAYYERTHRLLS